MTTAELFDYLFRIEPKEAETEDKPQEEERRTETIKLRLTPREKEILQELAKINYLDTATFIRWVIFKKHIDDLIK